MTHYTIARKLMGLLWAHEGEKFCMAIAASQLEAYALQNAVRTSLDCADCEAALAECVEELFRPLIEAELARLRNEKTHQLPNQKGGVKLLI